MRKLWQEKGRGKKKGSMGRGGVVREDSCSRAWSRAIPARKSAHLLNSRGSVSTKYKEVVGKLKDDVLPARLLEGQAVGIYLYVS